MQSYLLNRNLPAVVPCSHALYLTCCSSMVATRACYSFAYPLGAKVSPRLLAHSLDTPHFPRRSHAFAHCLFLLTAVGWPCLVSDSGREVHASIGDLCSYAG